MGKRAEERGAVMQMKWAMVLFLILRFPVVAAFGTGHKAYRLDPQISQKLQPRQSTLLPAHLREAK